MSRTYMYRATSQRCVESEIFDASNIPKGWYDSPGEAKKNISISDQEIGGVVFSQMGKDDLALFAEQHNITIDKRKSAEKIREDVEKAYGDRARNN